MRCLTLSIVLSLLSFNSYGNGPKVWFDLYNDSYRLFESAIEAGLSNQEPDHLLEVLEVEKRLCAEASKYKESTIGNDPIKWKKHALATMLSFNAARDAANNATNHVARDAARDDRNPVYTADRDASLSKALNAARNAAYNAVNHAAGNAGLTAAYNTDYNNSLWMTDYNTAYNTAYNVTRDASLTAAYNAAWMTALTTARDAATNAVKNLSDQNEIGRVAYRIAETQAWITVLDPSLNTFEAAYDAAYSHLENVSEEDLGPWFSSQENFVNKLNECFVDHEVLNDYSKQFLKHLVDYLYLIIPKMFP